MQQYNTSPSGFGAAVQDNMAGGFIQGAGASPDGEKKKTKQDMNPLTIHQVLNAVQPNQDDGFQVDNVELHQVKVIGTIARIDNSATYAAYFIQDGTGEIEVRVWSDNDNPGGGNGKVPEPVSQGMYVRVVGALRSFNNARSLTAFSVRPVTDFNEVTQHNLEVIKCHLENTRGAQGGNGMQQAVPGYNAGPMAMAGSNFPSQQHQPGMMQQQTAPAPMQPSAVVVGLENAPNPQYSMVFSVFQQGGDGEAGMAIADVRAQLQGQVSDAVMSDAIMWLSDEGHLYSTTDDEHYKATF